MKGGKNHKKMGCLPGSDTLGNYLKMWEERKKKERKKDEEERGKTNQIELEFELEFELKFQ